MSFTPPPDSMPKVYSIAADLPPLGRPWESLTPEERRAVYDVARRLGEVLAVAPPKQP